MSEERRKPRLIIGESSEDDSEYVAYIYLDERDGPTAGVVKRSVRLHDLLGEYKGPDVYLEFDDDNALIGIELLE